MEMYLSIAWIAFVINAFFAVYILHRDPKNIVHRLFALVAALLAFWNIGHFLGNPRVITAAIIFNMIVLGFIADLILKFRASFVKIITEEERKTSPLYQLKEGQSYLVKEEEPKKILQVFTDIVTHGRPGLLICRDEPEKIRKMYGLNKTPILWLSKKAYAAYSLDPGDLKQISFTVKEFFRRADKGVVGIEGLEYLILHNDFPLVLRAFDEINEVVIAQTSVFLFTVNPRIIGEMELNQIRRNIRNLEEI